VTQILTSGLGGYLTGRLRRRWLAADLDEVYFRDTAHGFLSWAVATLFTAALLTTALTELVNPGSQVGAAALSRVAPALDEPLSLQRGNAAAAENTWPVGYFVHSLFRQPSGEHAPSDVNAGAAHAEVTRTSEATRKKVGQDTAAGRGKKKS
jgi:hypothetical protein